MSAQDPKTELRPRPKGPPPEVSEDTTAQALSEALGSSFLIVKVVMALLVVLFLASGMVKVGPQEKAIKLRFGKTVGGGEGTLLGPGFHWAFPSPIDEIVRIPVGQVQSVHSSIGWYQTTAAQEAAKSEPEPRNALNPLTEGYVLTADENIIHARGTLRYRIKEPGLSYTFDFVDASNLVQHVFDNALVLVAAQYRVDDALTRDFAGFREKVRARVDQLVQEHGLGIIVDQVDLQVIPPRWLKASFDQVTESAVRTDKLLNDARSEANQMVNQAKAQAAALVNAGENDRHRLVELIGAEAKRFTDLLPDYRKDPRLFAKLRQTEVFSRVMTNAHDKWVLPRHAANGTSQLRLLISREPEKVGTIKPKPAEEGH